ncbi:hypothetical protein [Nonomuraea basaltis]|uniref:hypothetical protein n=1 Tax=Nonomuraea basaltis TaxID=2495887 RepID=UPI00110C40DC|nr:hypothetical protein [Nonomuraea basaltis]TMR90950.1 hypothetical protein EJK15_52605 [Nonomuraea basaltis]
MIVGELAGSLLQGGVLDDDPLDAVLWVLALKIADLAQEPADVLVLRCDLGVGRLQGLLGVEILAWPEPANPSGRQIP